MSDGSDKSPRPVEVRLNKEEKALEIDFDDGCVFRYPAEFLRVESPSAEVQGHSPSQRVIVPGKKQVAILGLEPIGHYALRIRFDDQHDTGIYSWAYLYEMGRDQDTIWQRYVEALESKGLSRET
tara:strand:- start:7024 stop:7398 length:375 start_codon:yes stop_codon:yes gene_type:complete